MVLDSASSIRRAAVALVVVSVSILGGCSSDSPTAPKDPPVEIKTPTKMRIDHILVQWTAVKKSNGDDWDYDPFNVEPRKPDIYFKLGNYETNVITNYDAGNQVGVQQLNFPAPNYGRMNYVGTYTLQLYDKDSALQGSDDLMGSFTFSPDAYYPNNNAGSFSVHMVKDGEFSIYADGIWIY